MPQELSKEVMARVALKFSREELCMLLAEASGRLVSLDAPLALEWDDETQELLFSFFESLTEPPMVMGDCSSPKKPGVRSEVLMILGDDDNPLTDNEIAERSPSGYTVGSLRRARKELLDKGFVEFKGWTDGEGSERLKLWGLVVQDRERKALLVAQDDQESQSGS